MNNIMNKTKQWIATGNAVHEGLRTVAVTYGDDAHARARLIARSLDRQALLERALPIIEAEAERRQMAMQGDSDRIYTAGDYWTEMRDLANEIAAEIANANGEQQ